MATWTFTTICNYSHDVLNEVTIDWDGVDLTEGLGLVFDKLDAEDVQESDKEEWVEYHKEVLTKRSDALYSWSDEASVRFERQ